LSVAGGFCLCANPPVPFDEAVQSESTPPPAPAGLGLGTTTFGREIDASASHRMLDHAYKRGIRHIDTAAAYSAGTAERILGEWLRANPGVRRELTIATKAVPPYSAAALEASVAASLGRLGLESVDLFYLHRWDPAAESKEVRLALDGLRRRGRIGALGTSNTTLGQLQTALAAQRTEGLAPFTWVQNNQNFAVRDAPAAFRACCHQEGVGVVTFSPLGAGFLTGKHTGGVVPGSRFAVAPAHGDIYFNATSRRRLDLLAATARELGLPQAALALAWALHRPLTRLVLIGGRDIAQIDQAFAARDPAFAPALAKLDALEPDGP